MSQTIETQLQNYDDHMIMKNFSVATRYPCEQLRIEFIRQEFF